MTLEARSAEDDVDTIPQLVSLAPKFDPEHHGMYVRVLDEELTSNDPNLRNIALTGAYGTGKSSILSHLLADDRDRVIEVSLSTLGAEPEKVDTGDGSNPAATTKTNRIQKEIVKQLLYQQAPKDSRESRFRRITRFPRRQEGITAGVVGVVIAVVLVITGIANPVLSFVGVPPLTPPGWLRAVGAVLLLTGVCAGSIYLARLALHHRLSIEKVTAGPATISLPPRSASYFDEYLDEIIYFFETNEKVDVVVFEDLDRFDDPHIFEALRALNNLLNTAKQLGERRRITFVYALRDSVFEQLGRDTSKVVTDELRAEIVRANRTKFFDLVVPVAPFISHKNARDLMAKSLEDRGHAISKELIDLAARHAADMRLIHNIVNEYAVFKDRLYDTDDRVPDLTPERLFAMVLYKNLHLADFEGIRVGQSTLDTLFDIGRELVEANVTRLREEELTIRAGLADESRGDKYATEVADRVVACFELATRFGRASHGSIHVNGSPVDDDELRTAALWRSIVAEGYTLEMPTRDDYGVHRTLTLTIDDLRSLTGHPIDFPGHDDEAIDTAHRRLSAIAEEIEDVLHHDWEQLAADTRFTYAADDADPRSFRAWVDSTLRTPLARDLVQRGYLTSYFSMHAASFHGRIVSSAATTYMMRNIDRGKADTFTRLEGDEVDALIRERPNFLAEDSVHNVTIVDHIIAKRSDVADTVLAKLARWGGPEREFVDTYLTEGMATSALIEYLTPRIPGFFDFLVTETNVLPEQRRLLVDTASHSWHDLGTYPPSPAVRAFLAESYSRFPSLVGPDQRYRADKAVGLLQRFRVEVSDVEPLNASARQSIIGTTAYAVTAHNLQTLTNSDDLSLDALRDAGGAMLPHALNHLPEYLEESGKAPGTRWTTADPNGFLELISSAAQRRGEGLGELIRRADRSCFVADLGRAPRAAWAPLVSDLRVPATYANVTTYLAVAGTVDESLAELLMDSRSVVEAADVEAPERLELAVSLLNARDVITDPEPRVALALSLSPGIVPLGQIGGESGELLGRLIEAGLVPGDEATFHAYAPDWPTLEYAISRTKGFSEFVAPSVLPSEYVGLLLESGIVPADVKRAVVTSVADFAANSRLAPGGREAVARYAVAHGMVLRRAQLEVLLDHIPNDLAVPLLAAAIDDLGSEDVRACLEMIGGEYAKVATVGSGYADLGDTAADRAIIRRMEEEGVVSSVKPHDGGKRVWRRKA